MWWKGGRKKMKTIEEEIQAAREENEKMATAARAERKVVDLKLRATATKIVIYSFLCSVVLSAPYYYLTSQKDEEQIVEKVVDDQVTSDEYVVVDDYLKGEFGEIVMPGDYNCVLRGSSMGFMHSCLYDSGDRLEVRFYSNGMDFKNKYNDVINGEVNDPEMEKWVELFEKDMGLLEKAGLIES